MSLRYFRKRARARIVVAWETLAWGIIAALASGGSTALADGKVISPRDYAGSLEELAQEAIIIFRGSETPGEATEDLILKIRVQGELDQFAWVIPLPNEPKVAEEDAAVFQELFDYVQARQHRAFKSETKNVGAARASGDTAPVEVISRQIVGAFDVAVVRENEPGKLNDWLETEGYQSLVGADDVLDFYRTKRYVYACVKVSQAQLKKNEPVDLHPLRFTFKTGGRDAIYFPMKLTALQTESFNVNLYVFYQAWLNDDLNRYGYVHRGFHLRHRDWDTRDCVPNGGKAYSAPDRDPYLRSQAHRLPSTTRLMQKLHPGARFYLTNIQAQGLMPRDVRAWADDLWLFPYYTDRQFVPFDARRGGVASAAWPNDGASPPIPAQRTSARVRQAGLVPLIWEVRLACIAGVGMILSALTLVRWTRTRAAKRNAEAPC
jgi:hypothetical protein